MGNAHQREKAASEIEDGETPANALRTLRTLRTTAGPGLLLVLILSSSLFERSESLHDLEVVRHARCIA